MKKLIIWLKNEMVAMIVGRFRECVWNDLGMEKLKWY